MQIVVVAVVVVEKSGGVKKAPRTLNCYILLYEANRRIEQ